MSCWPLGSLTLSPLPSTLSVHFWPVPVPVPVYFLTGRIRQKLSSCTFPFFILAVAGAASSGLLHSYTITAEHPCNCPHARDSNTMSKMTGETLEVCSDKRKPRENWQTVTYSHRIIRVINKDLSVFPSLCILCISQYCSCYKMFQIRLGRGIKVLQADFMFYSIDENKISINVGNKITG